MLETTQSLPLLQPSTSPPAPIRILILGAGIIGLSTALALSHKNQNHAKTHPGSPIRYHITILESASELQELGAGIQIPPNSSRFLVEWGLTEKFREKVCWPEALVVRKWDDGTRIGRQDLAEVQAKFGVPYWYIHRADYQQILYHAALEAGIEVRLNHRVQNITTTNGKPTIHLQDGTSMDADLLIGADGIHSRTRSFILGKEIKPLESNCCAYRVTIPASKMESNPITADLMSQKYATLWMNRDGHEGNVIGYPIRSGTVYNLVLVRPGNATLGKWNVEGDIAETRRYYAEWDETIGCLLEHVEKIVKWKLGYLPSLESWVGGEGNVVIVGDAAHAVLPHLAQGAALGMEDAVALAECLERVENVGDIPESLKAFQEIRKDRCQAISRLAREVANKGLAKKDANTETEAKMKIGIDRLVNNPDLKAWLYGYDSVKESKKYLDESLVGISNKTRNDGHLHQL